MNEYIVINLKTRDTVQHDESKNIYENVPKKISTKCAKNTNKYSKQGCFQPNKQKCTLKLSPSSPDQDSKDSSIQALSKIRKADTKVRKFTWLLLLFLGIGGCVYEIQKFLKIYLTFPIVITVEDEYESKLKFPAVTVCNLNRLKTVYDNCANLDIIKHCDYFDIDSMQGFMPFFERRKIISCSYFRNQTVFNSKRNESASFSRYMKMDHKNRRFAGHQKADLIKHCVFNMQLCSLDDFIHFQSLQYGNCFTFNKSDLESTSIGYESGLELLLNAEIEQYSTTTSSPAIGVRVSIHNISEAPKPEKDGVNISPGFETSIALTQYKIVRLPSPFKDHCVNYYMHNYYSNRAECIKMCLQGQSLNTCGCVDPSVILISDLKHCDFANKTDVCCLDGVQNQISGNVSICDCPLSCYSTSYHREISIAALPIKSRLFGNGTSLLTNFRDNYAVLRVFYKTLSHRTYKQLPMFRSPEIFSCLGGAMSLWLGISIFSFFEVADILIVFCRCASHTVVKILHNL
ncbi:acid-sensing ion channel 4-A-like [Parasteatoda tepidariorum]|uniref:acid-sensing ion channel 4-A-like n=1 Tax=Parasteatoda tepidariorum TaxID=114398 RepID=UPI0039BD1421